MFLNDLDEIAKKNPIKQVTGSQVPVTCLILQMMLHYNMIFSPIHYLLLCQEYFKKREKFRELDNFVATVCLTLGILVEVPRLTAGYLGNYHHRIRWLLLFLLMSSFFQLPIQMLTLQSALTVSNHVEITVMIMVGLVVLEVFTSIPVIKWVMGLWRK